MQLKYKKLKIASHNFSNEKNYLISLIWRDCVVRCFSFFFIISDKDANYKQMLVYTLCVLWYFIFSTSPQRLKINKVLTFLNVFVDRLLWRTTYPWYVPLVRNAWEIVLLSTLVSLDEPSPKFHRTQTFPNPILYRNRASLLHACLKKFL